ncbi:MAG: hypothetical protein K9M36_03430 [Candidatus Pacebacteria bacterium]|nr:hypothetical protein [Candidatus Paceibacterota bacterium]
MEAHLSSITQVSYARLLTPEPLVVIPCVGGKDSSLAYANDVFACIDSSFIDWNLNIDQPATEMTQVSVFEIRNVKEHLGQTILYFFKGNEESVAFESQKQIKQFAIDYPGWLCNKPGGTFFLFVNKVKAKNTVYLVNIKINTDGSLEVSLPTPLKVFLWNASESYRFVFQAKGLLVP